jgi:predicted phosphohydrolase
MNRRWLTDTHLNLVFDKRIRDLGQSLTHSHVDTLFISGDVSSGPHVVRDLRTLAHSFDGEIYFVLGNHDYHYRSVAQIHDEIANLCSQEPNLKWVTQEGVVSLSPNVALVGHEGWYDAVYSDPRWLKLTFDWFLTLDTQTLPSHGARVDWWRERAHDSAQSVGVKLTQALQTHSHVFVLTHFPPWASATTTRNGFWKSYNTNSAMGQEIERVTTHGQVTVLSGHTHVPTSVRVNDQIECIVGSPGLGSSIVSFTPPSEPFVSSFEVQLA